MQRLTHPRSSGIKTGYWSPNKKDELIERLAEYEDTGVTPQEIYSMKSGTILKAIGRYETDETGGAFYVGDDEESCIS